MSRKEGDERADNAREVAAKPVRDVRVPTSSAWQVVR